MKQEEEFPAERGEWLTMSDLDITEWIVRFRFGRVLLMLSRWLMKSLGWFLVSFALLAFSLIITFWFFVMIPMLTGDQSVLKFIVHFAMGVYISAALLFNYIMCIRTDPGKPPEDWKQQALQTGIINALTSPSPVEQQRWSTYCKRCDDPKPPRTHHCHICDRCVMRMDHHCPWVNNCVGYNNHRYFILFLSYMWFASAYIAIHIAMLMADLIWFDEHIYNRWAVYISFLSILCLSMVVVMGGFLGWHLYLVATNQTTIEFQFNKVQAIQHWSQRGSVILNEYDLGIRRNLQQIFGTSLLRCLLPSAHKPPLDGANWPTLSGLRIHKQNMVMA